MCPHFGNRILKSRKPDSKCPDNEYFVQTMIPKGPKYPDMIYIHMVSIIGIVVMVWGIWVLGPNQDKIPYIETQSAHPIGTWTFRNRYVSWSRNYFMSDCDN